jgi:hypothetical protein
LWLMARAKCALWHFLSPNKPLNISHKKGGIVGFIPTMHQSIAIVAHYSWMPAKITHMTLPQCRIVIAENTRYLSAISL